jgi:hypothetical protein
LLLAFCHLQREDTFVVFGVALYLRKRCLA